MICVIPQLNIKMDSATSLVKRESPQQSPESRKSPTTSKNDQEGFGSLTKNGGDKKTFVTQEMKSPNILKTTKGKEICDAHTKLNGLVDVSHLIRN